MQLVLVVAHGADHTPAFKRLLQIWQPDFRACHRYHQGILVLFLVLFCPLQAVYSATLDVVYTSTLSINNCTFKNNRATWGVLWLDGAMTEMTNCLWQNNTSEHQGGAYLQAAAGKSQLLTAYAQQGLLQHLHVNMTGHDVTYANLQDGLTASKYPAATSRLVVGSTADLLPEAMCCWVSLQLSILVHCPVPLFSLAHRSAAPYYSGVAHLLRKQPLRIEPPARHLLHGWFLQEPSTYDKTTEGL